MSAKMTAPAVRAMKQQRAQVVCVTAYDYPSARIADEAGVDVILVGDSVGNVVLGFANTLPVTLEMMVHHVAAVARAHPQALLVADLPFGSYQCGTDAAVQSAVALVRAGAEAVKLEGPYIAEIEGMIQAGIPVMGHVGMTPQSYHNFGGFRVQGKGDTGDAILSAAKTIEAAGAFAIVLELIPDSLAYRITEELTIPTIGIGAGPGCDGQIQVFHDAMGLDQNTPKHAKRYADARSLLLEGLKLYVEEVREKQFPLSREP